MKAMFDLTVDNLKLVIDGCSYIFEQALAIEFALISANALLMWAQAAFQGLGPEPMFEVLLEAGFENPHAKVFATEHSASGMS